MIKNKIVKSELCNSTFIIVIGLIVCFSFYSASLNGQTIKRWSGGKNELSSSKSPISHHTNIFKDFGWTSPNIPAREIYFENDSTQIYWQGKPVVIQKLADNKMLIELSDKSYSATLDDSNGFIYPSKSKLKSIPVVQNRWVSYTVMEQKSVLESRTRMVTRYQYNASTGSSTPVTSSETYYVNEIKSVPTTKQRWEPYTTYVLDIPNFKHYSFALNDSSRIIIYELKDSDDNHHYKIQNSSYLLATDSNGLRKILVDIDCNGYYNNPQDELLFNSWNPFSKESRFKSTRFFRANSWYKIDELKNDFFLDLLINNGVLDMTYGNEKYAGSKKKGEVILKDIPSKANVFVNGRKYRVPNGLKKFKCQYGKYRILISLTGHLDYISQFEINEIQPAAIFSYRKPNEAGLFQLSNVHLSNYSVEIKSGEKYSRTYFNQKDIQVPAGECIAVFSAEGLEFEYSFNIQKGAVENLDVNLYLISIIENVEPLKSDSTIQRN